jgi:hypothetical protein
MKEHFQVSFAAMLGIGSPGLNLVLDVVNPVLQALLTVGQIGVAIATVLYIYRKWKTAGKKSRRSRKSPPNEAP